ncbi:MAG: hypothetical protein JXB50_11455 [Spirochaetes bacterium]|nr:hypothetical protein [Spirochaetota bacterium]
MNKKCFFLILIILIAYLLYPLKRTTAKGKEPKSPVFLELMAGYAIPVNANYIDTYQNDDIYWNPNGGIDIDLRITIKFHPLIYFSIPFDTVFGFYKYITTDGRKVNTETQAGTTPVTTNWEWSVAPNIVPMIMYKPYDHPAVPYIGIGIGVGFLVSYESWEFTNVDDKAAKLVIVKYYLPQPSFKGEFGWYVPITKKLHFRIATVFNMVNYPMIRVVLTNYYIDGEDHISEYDEKSRIYNYAFNSPDENKGGDCLLAGFNYANWPEQKIGSNVTLKIGFAYNF